MSDPDIFSWSSEGPFCHWEAVTSDPFILNAIQHYNIEFEETHPLQACPPRNIVFSNSDKNVINDEITKLLTKGVIEHAHYTEDSYVSTVFDRPKKDGTHRMILNLKSLNTFVAYHHFKMDTFLTAIKLIRPGCFMASIDLKDAYYSIPYYQHWRLPKAIENTLCLSGRAHITNSPASLMGCHVLHVFLQRS